MSNQALSLGLKPVPIKFDLKGRVSGMFVVSRTEKVIRYNEIIFSHFFDDALVNTVAHEVAHYAVHEVWGNKRNKIKPHGAEWKSVMAMLGVKPEVTSHYDVSGLPLHQQAQFQYACICMDHQLSTTRHNRVQNKKAVYKCKKCLQPLNWLKH